MIVGQVGDIYRPVADCLCSDIGRVRRQGPLADEADGEGMNHFAGVGVHADAYESAHATAEVSTPLARGDLPSEVDGAASE